MYWYEDEEIDVQFYLQLQLKNQIKSNKNKICIPSTIEKIECIFA